MAPQSCTTARSTRLSRRDHRENSVLTPGDDVKKPSAGGSVKRCQACPSRGCICKTEWLDASGFQSSLEEFFEETKVPGRGGRIQRLELSGCRTRNSRGRRVAAWLARRGAAWVHKFLLVRFFHC